VRLDTFAFDQVRKPNLAFAIKRPHLSTVNF